MANSIIQLKYSDVTGNVPSSLANGEIAINTYDGKIFYRGGVSNTIQYIANGGGGAGNPAGLNKEIQFNDNGSFGANANLTFDKSTSTLTTTNVSANIVALTNYVQFGDGTRQYTANTTIAAIDRQTYTATLGQKTFSVNYTVPYVYVVINGVIIDPSEYTAISGSSITLLTGTQSGDIVDLVGFAGSVVTITTAIDQAARDQANAAFAKANTANGTGGLNFVDFGYVYEPTSYVAYDYGTL